MSSEENTAFIRAMIADFHVMNKMIAGIDVTTSEATNPADLEQIMTVVKDTIGVDTINSMVLAAIRGWMCSAAEEALSRAEGEDQEHDIVKLKLAMGSLYRGQGLVQKAESIFSECLDITTKDFGETHRHTVESMDALANCYYRQEKYDLAESLLVKCLEIRRKYYPEEHSDLVSSIGR
jgi:tetratricopeptide (TPR) repeat protein